MAEHVLKTWPNAFDAVVNDKKKFEWRKDDRGFEVGDNLVLKKWDPQGGLGGGAYVTRHGTVKPYTSSSHTYEGTGVVQVQVRVTYILRGLFGMPPDYCVMSIERMSDVELG